MCEICGYTECLPNCPGADEPKPIHYCEKCHDEIYAGDIYGDVDGTIYCEDCMKSFKRTAVFW